MYLDPGFGGMMIQVIIALVATGGALLFAFRKKLLAIFKNRKANTVSDITKFEDNAKAAMDDNVIDMLVEDQHQEIDD